MNALRMPAFVAVLAVLIAGCGKKTTEKKTFKVYDIQGKIIAIRPDKEAVTLDHEDIPGLMKGMKMQFMVEDARILEDLQVGDQVQGKLKVDSGSQIITELKKR
jgi:protein SCO1/2